MLIPTASHLIIWSIAAIAVFGVIVRPWRSPEFIWAIGGALLLLLSGLLPWRAGWLAARGGADVYCFLAGMMLLSELARREGLFDYLAAFAVVGARGSPRRLFALIYAAAVIVTIFMSNDATAVVMTPAVYAASKRAGAKPLPYLLICAFVANAASFVLPISNPANLVIFGDHTPALGPWLKQFGLPSLVSIVISFATLYLLQRRQFGTTLRPAEPLPSLSHTAIFSACGIGAAAVVLLVCSALDVPLGLPTACASLLVAVVVWIKNREAPWPTLQAISWSVLALVAGLFILVEALRRTGLIDALATGLHGWNATRPIEAAWGSAALLAVTSNLVNNLPTGLAAGLAASAAHASAVLKGALTIGVDLGPNLSVTGSLATILWLTAIRREGQDISAWRFLRLGLVMMPVALLPAVGVLLALAA
ncbi:MAG: SLC13 family permease [Janthinobacterium lividum]